jgi:predicted cupin superfamily sugar epimerase
MTERTPASALTADEIITHLKLGPVGISARPSATSLATKAARTRLRFFICSGQARSLAGIKHGETRHEHRLGPEWLKGEHPHVLVPAGAWQSARNLGPWTLSGCTVAPGFDFSGFELAPDDWMR